MICGKGSKPFPSALLLPPRCANGDGNRRQKPIHMTFMDWLRRQLPHCCDTASGLLIPAVEKEGTRNERIYGLRYTVPSFITKFTCSIRVICSKGLPGTATTSASLPGSTVPSWPSRCMSFAAWAVRSEEHTSELQSRENLVC